MFRPSYLKEGPGIAKDAPEKTGAAWVGETLAREFCQLVKLNVLFLLCCLPVVTFGAARAAMARCTVNMARDVPNDAWTDFRAALRQDTVRNLLCGLAELALLWMGVMLVTADFSRRCWACCCSASRLRFSRISGQYRRRWTSRLRQRRKMRGCCVCSVPA